MKKLIIAFAAVALAIGSQAAAMSWKTGNYVKSPTSASDGTFGTSNAGSGTLSLYVWIVSESIYNSASLSSMTSYDSISKIAGGSANPDGVAASASVTGAKGSTGATASWTYSSDDWSTESITTIYGLVLTTYKSGDIDMYIANKATGTINTAGTASAVGNLAKYIGGDSSGTAITGWSTNVPEPTSALLMLLGFAGLALRRKRA